VAGYSLQSTGIPESRCPAERVRRIVAWPVRARGETHPITCSVGISFFPENGLTAARMIRAADQVMYRVKREGGLPFCSTRG